MSNGDQRTFEGKALDDSRYFRESLEVTAALLQGDLDFAAERIIGNQPPASEFLSFAGRHGLNFYLAIRLDSSALRRSFRDEDVSRLEAHLANQRKRQRELCEELERLADICDAHSIQFLLLKGPYIAERCFGGIEERGYGDLDILVQHEELPRIREVLRSNGYLRRSSVLLSHSLTTYFTHGYDYRRAGLPLDLHWSLGAHVSYKIDYDALWTNYRSHPIASRRYGVLSDEYALLHHLLSFFEDLDRGAGKVKNVVDIYQMLRVLDDSIDWMGFFARRENENVATICRSMLRLTLDLFQCSERFPNASAALGVRPVHVPNTWEDIRTLIESPRSGPKNKLWASRVYDCSHATSFAWWIISLPFRVSVYHPGKVARFFAKLSISRT